MTDDDFRNYEKVLHRSFSVRTVTVSKKVHRTTTFAVSKDQWQKGCRERPELPGFYGTKSK